MSRDVITVGSTMRISLLYRGEYSQWRERFMNYLEEQTDGEAMINSIQNGDQPLHVIAPVSLSGTAQNASPTLKDLKFWTAEEKKTRKIDCLARSLLIQGLPNDIYSLTDSNETAKDLWDALERQMRGFEYGSFTLNQQTTTKDDEKKRDVSKVKCYNCKKEGHFAKDCKKAKVKDYNYYKTKMLLAKKDSDEQVLLAEDQAWMEFTIDSDLEINANMVFMAQIEKVLSDSDESSLSAEETIAEVAYYTSESGSESEFETSEYYDNSTNYGLFVNDNDDQEIFHDALESASENFIGNHIDSQKDYDRSEVDHNDSKEKEHLVDKLIRKFNRKIAKLNTFEEQNNEFNEQIKVLNEKNADLLAQTEVLQDKLKVKHVVIDTHTECQAQYAKLEEERYEYMIRYSALCDNDKQHRKKIDEQEILFDKMSRQLVEMNNNVLRLQEKILEKKQKFQNWKGVVRRPKHSGVIWKKKGSSNTSNIDLSSVSHSKLNKDVKRYSRKHLLLCNNSHLGETSSAYVCYDAMNVSCNSRLCDLFDENDLFIFDDESVRISPVSKTPFRKKPRDSLNVGYKSNSNKSLPRTMHGLLPKMQLLAEPVAKWFPRIVQICLWIIDSGFSKHMKGNRALLTNFMEKFLGTVRFGNNDFAMIAGYGDVVIGSMTIKKVYYVEGLGHNLFSVG
nr:integrase, catalytic region, zinc finger, CCHC-type, peptidase aspartic, catalytic [Tanacetum cinerariifolium]